MAGYYDYDSIDKSKLTAEFEKGDFDLLICFLSKFRKIIVTPHVLAEVSNLINTRVHKSDFADFIEKIIEILSDFKEVYVQKDEIISREELKNYLESMGFVKCKYFWDWPKGTLNYSWFDYEDFKSIDGVSSDIYPLSGEELSVTGNNWALHVRNLYGASWHDVKMLNDVLRVARKLFGGTIKGDYGTNRYAPLWDDDSTPISRGISGIYSHVNREISAVKFALPDPSIKQQPHADGKIDDFIEFTQNLDPSRVIYNGLVPFAVSMFEYFFSQAFQVLIKYDNLALKKRSNHKQKLDFETLLEIEKKEDFFLDIRLLCLYCYCVTSL